MMDLLNRGVDKVYPSREELQKVLESGKKLTLYQGFDPTGTQLHLGHMVGLKKLRQWQDLGHHVIFLIGDATALIGDPTGKNKTRARLTKEEVLKNAQNYKEQASRILDFEGENPVEIKFNSEWLDKLSYQEFMNLASMVSYNQIVERDLFQERIKKNESISMLELIYPLIQGYDSVHMEVDLELGGSDQTFNMLVGRSLMKSSKNRDKFVMTTPLLEDSGGRKIGKTEGNVIGLTDDPSELYRKIMALGDDVIIKAFECLTDVPMGEIHQIEEEMEKGENPRDFKKKLAYEITKDLNDEAAAEKAQDEFERVVQNKELPQELPLIEVSRDRVIDEDLLVEFGFANSKSDAKRLFEQDGVKLDGQKIKLGQALADEEGETLVFGVGKRLVSLKVN